MMFCWSADVLITLLFSSELSVTSITSTSREVDSSWVSSLSSIPGLVKLTSFEMTVLTLVEWLPFNKASTWVRILIELSFLMQRGFLNIAFTLLMYAIVEKGRVLFWASKQTKCRSFLLKCLDPSKFGRSPIPSSKLAPLVLLITRTS